jgi:hypothetical protein
MRVLGSAVAVGAALLLSACGQQPQTPMPMPMPPSLSKPGDIGQPPIVANGSATTSTESTPEAQPPAPQKSTPKTTPKTTQPQPDVSKEFWAATYVDSTERQLVQRPSQFIPPNVTGEYASEVNLMNLAWSRWGDNGGSAVGTAYVTGGGAPPETIQNVQLFVDSPQLRNGKMQYTHYMVIYPGGETDEGQLNTL